MVRAIAVVGLIVGLIAAVVFGPRMLGDAVNQSGSGQPMAECNLLAAPCQWTTPAGKWEATLDTLTGEGEPGIEYQLTVTTPQRPERFLAVLRGESMYMGEYPVPLGNRIENKYSARFTAPFCTMDSAMTWRIDLQQGQEPIGDIPLKLVFQAQSR
ncbi:MULTISPECIES: hypothetical protein [Marinobacter]|uniref:Uncharacterized protein n=1 Tax=Marinobacter metalliresistant TaxID=2961995 RepID=A0ABZ2W3U8_9GAMM|nr:hypothetical protein [Marinobacter sp. Arc7-DN-1]AXS85143.1 hypothetical protein D0851_02185 [Marinobacter sp. Arc7-DN-1]